MCFGILKLPFKQFKPFKTFKLSDLGLRMFSRNRSRRSPGFWDVFSSLILPCVAGEEQGGGLNGLNDWNVWNARAQPKSRNPA